MPVKKPKGKVAMGGMQAKVVNCEPKAQEMINNCKDALIGMSSPLRFPCLMGQSAKKSSVVIHSLSVGM